MNDPLDPSQWTLWEWDAEVELKRQDARITLYALQGIHEIEHYLRLAAEYRVWCLERGLPVD